MMEPEIIDFYRPDDNAKILFISNVPYPTETWNPNEYLLKHCSHFGLIYEIRVVENTIKDPEKTPAEDQNRTYAFVTFYSKHAAEKAKNSLAGRLFVQGKHLSLRFSNKQRSPDKPILYHSKCFELANHYLGFNGWTTERVSSEADMLEGSDETSPCVLVRSIVRLSIPEQGLSTLGHGAVGLKWNLSDPEEKTVAYAKCRNNSYHCAIQDAFRKLLLVVLANGKVHPEINTLLPDTIAVPTDEELGLLKVQDLENDPDDGSEAEEMNDTEQLDDMNKHILAQLLQDGIT